MDILTAAVETEPAPRMTPCPDDGELEELRAQVKWLRAERAALLWAVGHDDLTGLPNRRLFHTLAPRLLDTSSRRTVVIVIDLNGFKPINDRFGHDSGDRVLRIVAERLTCHAGDGLVARLGGDEFAAVLTAPLSRDHGWWQPIVSRLSASIAEPMRVAGQSLTVTASIGVASTEDHAPVGELLRRADLAMYRAKVAGGSATSWESMAEAAGWDRPARVDAPAADGRVVELAVFCTAAEAHLTVSTPQVMPPRPPHCGTANRGYHHNDAVWRRHSLSWRSPLVTADAAAID